ncbi:2-oxoadipate dioxygenase/decarboxylase family protein [Aeromicrobium sp. CTD01-1L150]|uniref:2-oxoadipate dioxygenase/decarboxylase n=1 Tax=Aeromicrobium sp. CTD01-1L150 TaxID=3341830 RepID=UPI0035C0FE55
MTFQSATRLRARFARGLSQMYGEEVPAYTTLVDVSAAVNEDVVGRRGAAGERLGSIERVTAERHGAIRVGSAQEMAQVARVFAAFGMHPVGFYDLRDASTSSVPVVSTAFRPTDPDELAANPFRVFTSMLTADDPRFFDAELRQQLQDFIGARTLFSPELLALSDQAIEHGGLQEPDADRLVQLATQAFELSDDPVDHAWYRRLEDVSAVAADIGGVASTHINHLTPRVLDIDDLYARMQARGIVMIDEIQGPPRWDGPDVLLRQTSFRALAEARTFRFEDGTVGPSDLRVRFGEVEQRGIALTPAGRELYDFMVSVTDRRLAAGEGGGVRAEVARTVWEENLPRTEKELALQALAYFTFTLDEQVWAEVGSSFPGPRVSLTELVEAGAAVPEPIVYEDFLPRSAAGIFQSNLTDEGSRDDAQRGIEYDLAAMSRIVGRTVADPHDLYQRQQDDSIAALSARLGLTITS